MEDFYIGNWGFYAPKPGSETWRLHLLGDRPRPITTDELNELRDQLNKQLGPESGAGDLPMGPESGAGDLSK
tara:strand:- start:2846 stop:3061 length:216 start_codon:yes stop_codon:yes gene_type:complete